VRAACQGKQQQQQQQQQVHAFTGRVACGGD
jgi:hypothetical protein